MSKKNNKWAVDTYFRCAECQRTMSPANGGCLVRTRTNAGRSLPRKRYPASSEQPCHDCGAAPNTYHHIGCDMDVCSICEHQAFICGHWPVPKPPLPPLAVGMPDTAVSVPSDMSPVSPANEFGDISKFGSTNELPSLEEFDPTFQRVLKEMHGAGDAVTNVEKVRFALYFDSVSDRSPRTAVSTVARELAEFLDAPHIGEYVQRVTPIGPLRMTSDGHYPEYYWFGAQVDVLVDDFDVLALEWCAARTKQQP